MLFYINFIFILPINTFPLLKEQERNITKLGSTYEAINFSHLQ
jgi:hypothetical protein